MLKLVDPEGRTVRPWAPISGAHDLTWGGGTPMEFEKYCGSYMWWELLLTWLALSYGCQVLSSGTLFLGDSWWGSLLVWDTFIMSSVVVLKEGSVISNSDTRGKGMFLGRSTCPSKMSWAWWLMPVTPALGRLWQQVDCCEFGAQAGLHSSETTWLQDEILPHEINTAPILL